jgi:hypothetical protein
MNLMQVNFRNHLKQFVQNLAHFFGHTGRSFWSKKNLPSDGVKNTLPPHLLPGDGANEKMRNPIAAHTVKMRNTGSAKLTIDELSNSSDFSISVSTVSRPPNPVVGRKGF